MLQAYPNIFQCISPYHALCKPDFDYLNDYLIRRTSEQDLFTRQYNDKASAGTDDAKAILAFAGQGAPHCRAQAKAE